MYNRYIPNGTSYTRVVEQDGEPPRRQAPPPPRPEPERPAQSQNHAHQGQEQGQPQHQERPQSRDSHTGQNRGPVHAQKASDPLSSLLSGFSGGKKNAGLAGILEKFKLDDIDTGDILLILILLFLFRDGDDIELVITLGLILLLGLGDKEKEKEEDCQDL